MLLMKINGGVEYMCNNDDNECRCLSEILKVICVLQKNAVGPEACLDTCDRGFLGCSTPAECCNTRPIMLYTSCGNGTPWSMPITKDNVVCGDPCVPCSNVFRVEKVDGCCCTFRVLAENPEAGENCKKPFIATNSFFTMNLECVCCLRCLPDTCVECI
jgi:hypothetical protein